MVSLIFVTSWEFFFWLKQWKWLNDEYLFTFRIRYDYYGKENIMLIKAFIFQLGRNLSRWNAAVGLFCWYNMRVTTPRDAKWQVRIRNSKKIFSKLQDYKVSSQGNAFENSHRFTSITNFYLKSASDMIALVQQIFVFYLSNYWDAYEECSD